MIKIGKKSNIAIVKEKNKDIKKDVPKNKNTVSAAFRPKVVDAKVYKVKSAFVKNSVFITLSYIDTDNGRKPIEIFINSKDLNRAPEYVVLTRLISAIFRRATDPMFILEELHGIHDPNGGSFREGKYYHSFYAEVAETIERFFYDVGIFSNDNKSQSSSIKKNFDAKEERPELLSATASKFDVRNSEICSAPRCDKPTVPNAIANRTI